MQRINNYGSLLQSYALKSMVESLGHEVGFLDIETGDTTHAGEAPSDSPTRHLRSIGGDNFVYKLKEKLVVKRQLAYFRTRFLGMSGELDTDSSAFDAAVIGSDEVFSCSVGCSRGFSPQLFGEVRSNSVISYAVSCGYARPEDVLDVHSDALAVALGILSAVSVRDESTRRFVTAFVWTMSMNGCSWEQSIRSRSPGRTSMKSGQMPVRENLMIGTRLPSLV